MMILRNMFQILLLLVSVKTRAQTAVANRLAKEGCQERCGNVSIPFPFGMGPSACFLDDQYEIVCQNSTGIPRLKKLDMDVLDITLPDYRSDANGMITVEFPIIYSKNCSNRSVEAVTLEGSPFVISQDYNTFVAVGCNGVVLLENTESAVVGCKLSDCQSGSRLPSGIVTGYADCSGSSCCMTTVPVGLHSFNVTFQKDEFDFDTIGDCHYAALVDKSSPLRLDGWKRDGRVPTVLLWGVPEYSNNPYFGYHTFYDRRSHYICDNTSLSYRREIALMQCYCRYGYRGNAYVEDGCQDINECNEYEDACSRGTKCVNRVGDYHCVDAKMRIRIALIVIGAVLGALLLLAFFWWLHKTIKRRRQTKQKEKNFKRNGGLILQQQLSSPEGSLEKNKLFNSRELEKATDNFSEDRVLGRGGQGTVFKGMLVDGRIVAIKKSREIDEGFVEQFINEVVILSQINHRNVVKLLGCCLETKVPLLVYEFIPNGTLYQYLHDPIEDFPVSWEVRLRIACEVAGALSYLHSAASMPIYHRDVKSTNILLDEKYRAKVADFGTSRSVSLEQTHVTTLVQGTFGYLDPEYFQSSQFTDKSDVYSFGVVLVELLTGQKPVSSLRANEGRSLATYFIISMEENRLFEILDEQVLNQAKKEEILAVSDLAKRCLYLNGRCRPTMKEVAMELEGIRNPRHPNNLQGTEEKGGSICPEAIFGHNVAFPAADPDIVSISDVHPLLFTDTYVRQEHEY